MVDILHRQALSAAIVFLATAGAALADEKAEAAAADSKRGFAANAGVGLDIGSGDLAFRLSGIYLDGPKNESGALITAGFNYRF